MAEKKRQLASKESGLGAGQFSSRADGHYGRKERKDNWQVKKVGWGQGSSPLAPGGFGGTEERKDNWQVKKVGWGQGSSRLVPTVTMAEKKRQLTSKESGLGAGQFSSRASGLRTSRKPPFHTHVRPVFRLWAGMPNSRNARTQCVSCACRNAHRLQFRHFRRGTSENANQNHNLFREHSPN